jgi:hypothetical protein
MDAYKARKLRTKFYKNKIKQNERDIIETRISNGDYDFIFDEIKIKKSTYRFILNTCQLKKRCIIIENFYKDFAYLGYDIDIYDCNCNNEIHISW